MDSVILGGRDQDVRYKEIFIGFEQEWIPQGFAGCALTCAPYLVLAMNAAPDPASLLLSMPLSPWQERFGASGEPVRQVSR